jgi:N-ethylmaleimide reductase
MAEYYGQRAGAGLIITEGTTPSPNGAGYARIPGIYNQAQVEAWQPIVESVHKKNSRFFLQLMHTGRVSHPDNLPAGAEVIAPSAIELTETKMWTDQAGQPEPMPVAREMTTEDIKIAIDEYANAAENAIKAGFDGVEIHGANGYLVEQFLNPHSNHRNDAYGGDHVKRSRFALEVAQSIAERIGSKKTGIRLSPGGAFNEVVPFDGMEEAYKYLAGELQKIGLIYIHVVDHSAMGAPEVPRSLKESIRDEFGGTIIISGGYDYAKANQDLNDGLGHLVAFGRPILANPDLVERFRVGAELNPPDFDTFYTPGEKGYTDYPTL